jgi:hypothetical protein
LDTEGERIEVQALALKTKYEAALSPVYFEGAQWAVPAKKEVMEGLSTQFANPDSYPINGRGLAYALAFFSPKHLGAGQFYLMTIKDKVGKPFDGSGTYPLTYRRTRRLSNTGRLRSTTARRTPSFAT